MFPFFFASFQILCLLFRSAFLLLYFFIFFSSLLFYSILFYSIHSFIHSFIQFAYSCKLPKGVAVTPYAIYNTNDRLKHYFDLVIMQNTYNNVPPTCNQWFVSYFWVAYQYDTCNTKGRVLTFTVQIYPRPGPFSFTYRRWAPTGLIETGNTFIRRWRTQVDVIIGC